MWSSSIKTSAMHFNVVQENLVLGKDIMFSFLLPGCSTAVSIRANYVERISIRIFFLYYNPRFHACTRALLHILFLHTAKAPEENPQGL